MPTTSGTCTFTDLMVVGDDICDLTIGVMLLSSDIREEPLSSAELKDTSYRERFSGSETSLANFKQKEISDRLILSGPYKESLCTQNRGAKNVRHAANSRCFEVETVMSSDSRTPGDIQG
jgi:hypothetical protein